MSLINIQNGTMYMIYRGCAEDFLREYERHNFHSDQWYHERTVEEKIALAQHAIELPGIPSQNFDRLRHERWMP